MNSTCLTTYCSLFHTFWPALAPTSFAMKMACSWIGDIQRFQIPLPAGVDWMVGNFFIKELIILTPSGVEFTTMPVTERCVSQSLACI